MTELSFRLRTRVDDALRFRLTEIVAPAGFGKSTLLEYISERSTLKLARVRANDAPVLALLRALCSAVADVAPELLRLLPIAYTNAAAENNLAGLAEWFLAAVAGLDGTLAVDDLHLLGDDGVAWGVLEEIVEGESGSGLRWIFSSRAPLALPTVHWVARGELGRAIDVDDLTFTRDDVLAAAHGIEVVLEESEATQIAAAARGWPLLCGYVVRMGLGRDGQADLNRTQGVESLAAMLLRRLSHEQRRVLLAAVLLEAAAVPELEQLGFDKPGRTLIELIAAGAPLLRSGDGRYRLHDLMRDYIMRANRAEIIREGRSMIDAFTHQDRLEDALRIATLIGATDSIARLLQVYPRYFGERADPTLVAGSLNCIPLRRLESDPYLATVKAFRLVQEAQFDLASRFFRIAVELAMPELRATAICNLGLHYINFSRDPAEGHRLLEEALTHPLPESPDSKCDILVACALTFASRQRYDETDAILSSAFSLEDRLSDPLVRARLYQRAAYTKWMTGRVDEAESLVAQALQMSLSNNLPVLTNRCYGLLYAIACERPAQALRYAEEWLESCDRMMERSTAHRARNALLEVVVRRGMLARAETLSKTAAPIPASLVGRDGYARSCATGLLQMLRGEYRDAVQIFAAAPQPPSGALLGQAFLDARHVEMAGFSALAACLAGDDGVAFQRSRDAVREAERLYQSRPFRVGQPGEAIELGALCAAIVQLGYGSTLAKRLMTVIAAHSRSPHRAACASWITRLFDDPHAEPEAPVDDIAGFVELFRRVLARCPQGEQITAAERRVLQLLVGGKTTKEIATILERSPKTVDNQITSLLRKLDAHSRVEAVMTAQRRGLLDLETASMSPSQLPPVLHA